MKSSNPRPLPGPNAHLIGRVEGAAQLSTPCLVLDKAAFERNITTAARRTASSGVALRPHAKTHKSSAIAKAQIAAGASGICTATIGEAEALAATGIDDILVTSTFTQDAKIARAVALARLGVRLTVVVDDGSVAQRLAAAAEAADLVLPVLIDVDLGRHRNGVISPEAAVQLAACVAAWRGLRLDGIQAYASHISHVERYPARLEAARACDAEVMRIRTALQVNGHAIKTVTGGSTGTLFIDLAGRVYTELQAGSYVFSDAEYAAVALEDVVSEPFAPSLFVRVSVIGRNWPGRVTCDGGNKHFSARGTLPVFARPPVAGAVYRPDSDEHGIIDLPAGTAQPALGETFELVVPHCDPTVNLFDAYHVIEDGMLVDIWPIEARGAF